MQGQGWVARLGDLGFKRWSSDVQKQTRHGRWRTGAETETEMGSESLMVVFPFFFLPPKDRRGEVYQVIGLVGEGWRQRWWLMVR